MQVESEGENPTAPHRRYLQLTPVIGRRAAILMACAVGLAALTLWASSGRYLPGEQEVLLLIVEHRAAPIDMLARSLSTLGSINVVLPPWAILIAVFALRRHYIPMLRLLPVPLAYPLYAVIKNLVARPGPTPPLYPWLYDLSVGYYLEGLMRHYLQELPSQGVTIPPLQQAVTAQSIIQVMESGYISGHALVAAIIYGTLAGLLWKDATPRSVRRFVATLLGMLALLVGAARIYMGIHFPSDVLGAWLLAGIWLLLSIRREQKDTKR